jgi:DNA-binding response OmpR family regulator
VIVLGREEADVVDRVHALRRGCDDYLAQPFDYQELVERIRAVLRRSRPPELGVIDASPVQVDVATRDVRIDGRRVALSQKEFQLLVCLAREPRRVFTKAELLHDVWNYRATGRTRTLDSHASRLRRKLRDAAVAPVAVSLVENVWGVGYRLLGELPED